jgi:hypothetical protein
MKIYVQMINRLNPPLFVGIGFGIGGILQWLFLRPWSEGLATTSMVVVGAIGGAFLASRSIPRRSAIIGAASYSVGFLLGGPISVATLMNFLGPADPSIPFSWFYPLFTLGFGIAGASSAGLMRPRLITVTTSTVCFLIGGGVGGAVVGLMFGSPMAREDIAGIGLLITYAVIGAICGRALELSEATTDT